jgi:glycosyltransferase involved in cell wall biosynthesis
VEDLVIAAGLLAERGVPVEVTLQGAGPLEARLRAVAAAMGVADRVAFGGHVAWDGLPDVYRAHDVFVLASAPTVNWREQFGFAVVEAMACGLPVLAGASGSLDEVVGDPEQLVRPHDPTALADALAALTDPALRRERGAANRVRAEARYDRRKVADAILRVYERALAAPSRS